MLIKNISAVSVVGKAGVSIVLDPPLLPSERSSVLRQQFPVKKTTEPETICSFKDLRMLLLKSHKSGVMSLNILKIIVNRINFCVLFNGILPSL